MMTTLSNSQEEGARKRGRSKERQRYRERETERQSRRSNAGLAKMRPERCRSPMLVTTVPLRFNELSKESSRRGAMESFVREVDERSSVVKEDLRPRRRERSLT